MRFYVFACQSLNTYLPVQEAEHVCMCALVYMSVCGYLFLHVCMNVSDGGEQMYVPCWMTMHVFAECLGDWRLWLSFVFCMFLFFLTPACLGGWVGGDISLHSAWQTSIIKNPLRMLIYRRDMCAAFVCSLLFWTSSTKISPVGFLRRHRLNLNFTAHCWSVNLSVPTIPLLFLITSAARLTGGSQKP